MARKEFREIWYDNSGVERDNEFRALLEDVCEVAYECDLCPVTGFREAIDAMYEYIHRNDVVVTEPAKPSIVVEEVTEPEPKPELELRVGRRYRTSDGSAYANKSCHNDFPIEIMGWYYAIDGRPLSPGSAPKILGEVRP